MKLIVAIAALVCAEVSAFAPAMNPTQTVTALSATLNGWTPDETKFAYGLPGAVAPFGEGFDPFGIASRSTADEMKSFRESEVTHGRVAMLAGTCACGTSRCLFLLLVLTISIARCFARLSGGIPHHRGPAELPSSVLAGRTGHWTGHSSLGRSACRITGVF
jgi:Chlorophyll A-B binding protein